MEEHGLGTKTTRAGIIQTLYERKYIRNERIEVTDLGLQINDVLKRNCPPIVSLGLTRTLEEEMIDIQQGMKTKETVLKEAIEVIRNATDRLKQKESSIGEQLTAAIRKAAIEEQKIGMCPTCHSGKLLILRSKKTDKRFIGCTNYFEGKCKTAFPLPQKGKVIKVANVCNSCGWPKIGIAMSGKRQWHLCLNSKCPSRSKEGRNPEKR
jgi:DNA topoisomerase-1